jgi:GDP/UDP-N,N'-diacetylbacillosamine 2-epimerase (hydrolysing)
MKKIISVLTATRAEYGLLKPIITKLIQLPEFDVRIAVTGMHLSDAFGMTYREIEQDGFAIDASIDILQDTDTPVAVSKAMGKALIEFAEYFQELKPDLLLVLGDRYETLAVCCAAMNARIPIAHLYGGETTEGAVDEAIRHAITKMSYLHFTSTAKYRKRVIQLGEDPERVHQVGAIGIENIKTVKLLSKSELEQSINHVLDQPYAIVTFHPVTLDLNNAKEQVEELLRACDQHKELFYIFTKANADAGGLVINRAIEQYVSESDNACLFDSLGMLRYLSAIKYCEMVIGNSSSGIIEVPSFGVPTVNIGDRQKGRMQSDSVINCIPTHQEISSAIELAMSLEFKDKAKRTVNPYGDGMTSDKIVSILKESVLEKKINLMKKFNDIEF